MCLLLFCSGNGTPIQSKSFKVLQQVTNTDSSGKFSNDRNAKCHGFRVFLKFEVSHTGMYFLAYKKLSKQYYLEGISSYFSTLSIISCLQNFWKVIHFPLAVFRSANSATFIYLTKELSNPMVSSFTYCKEKFISHFFKPSHESK